MVDAVSTELSLSDAGWAGALACGGLLIALRLLRDALHQRETHAKRSLAAVLTKQLWHFSPASLRRLESLRRLQHCASVVVSGACAGCFALSVSARLVRRAHVAVAIAAVPAIALWLPLGSALWLGRRRRLRMGLPQDRTAPPELAPSREAAAATDKRLPVTVVTGFLGSGKSTLLKRILSEEHGKKLLVIENELGEEGIDHELLVQGGQEEIVLLKNGCVCCSVRQDLRAALRELLPRAAELDGVLIETTGVARPAPVVSTFLWDADLKERLRLDAVITVVDCKHVMRMLLAPPSGGGGGGAAADALGAEACREQIGFADRLLLNKADLVWASELAAVAAAARAINPSARQYECRRADAPLAELLGQHAFEMSAALERDPSLRDAAAAAATAAAAAAAAGATGAADADADAEASQPTSAALGDEALLLPSFLPHSQRIGSVSLHARELELDAFNAWVAQLLQRRGDDILRLKGILAMRGHPRKFVCHGVHMVFEGAAGGEWAAGQPRASRLVLIGRNLVRRELQAGLARCEAAPETCRPAEVEDAAAILRALEAKRSPVRPKTS